MTKLPTNTIRFYIALISLTACLSGCQRAYYKRMETFGKHKRDILISRVEEARDAQEDTKEQFKTEFDKSQARANAFITSMTAE